MTQDIIAGGGRVGFQTAELLAPRDETVTTIEADEDRITEIADAWIATVIQGDASDPEISNKPVSTMPTPLPR